ncbi:unnamed protein product [Bursaphelenchus okinawaensis]|uniref:CULT domain-containing protein n=1 Tax=Bursaphelenchus okinawaensis TaxID=465554 RepID=A0A811KRB9_9BILA|nr:unnamed protein product [Bursaphelenchus okinawaensis]CAG9111421.1 unnamed protein product [Bursaphelenchus okinawaensis]
MAEDSDAEDNQLFEESEATTSEEEESEENYDPNEAAQHLYLSSLGTLSYRDTTDLIEPGTEVKVMVFLVETMVLPFEEIPVNVTGVMYEEVSQYLQNGQIGFITLAMHDDGSSSIAHNVGVLGNLTRVIDKNNGFALVGLCRQRFAVVNEIRHESIRTSDDIVVSWVNSLLVKVLPDTEPNVLMMDQSSTVAKYKGDDRRQYFEYLYGIPSQILYTNDVSYFTGNLIKWFSKFFSEQKLKNELEKGVVSFSYWVARSLPIDNSMKYKMLEEYSTLDRIVVAWKTAQRMNSFACVDCKEVKFRINDIFTVMPSNLSAQFVNPHGYVHEMFTSHKMYGIRVSSHSSLQDSWFPGYSWSILNCNTCLRHIGWLFKNNRRQPNTFYGVTRQAIEVVIDKPVEEE